MVGPDGRATFCCEILTPLTVNGERGHIARDAFDDLWNAPEIVDVRSAMARGDKPPACGSCWKREAAGGISRRLLMNAGYRDFAGHAIEKLPEIGSATGYKLEQRPSHIVLEMGSICNLKCRSCCALLSTRIAADRVHTAWNGADALPSGIIRVNGVQWFEDADALAGMVAEAAGTDIMLTLMGGEPFLIPSVWTLLTELVKRGVAHRIYVGLSSNGQQIHPRLEELVPQFRGFNVSVSVDGCGKVYEYLRNGADWRKLLATLDGLRRIPGLDVCAVPTVQSGNALDLVNLLRFLDERDVRVMYNVLNEPARLSIRCLPPEVRRIAERRLRNYLDDECRAVNMAVVRAYCEALDPGDDTFDAELFAEFMQFTNDLDASRGESLHEAIPELSALLRAAGVEWSDARRHMPPDAPAPSLSPGDILARVNRTVSERDVIFPGFETLTPGSYFTSAAQQMADIETLLREHGHPGLTASRAVADVASHYGRMTRVLRAALPSAAVYALDIDTAAVQFCADELGALPVVIGWQPDADALPEDLDAFVCVSLLTHTPLDHWRRSLRAWARMLRPGGVGAFTYLADRRLAAWRAGDMLHYGTYDAAAHDDVERAVAEAGFGFASLTSSFGGRPLYGIAFVTAGVVAREIEAAGLEVLALPSDSPYFGQELAIVRKPGDTAPRPIAAAPAEHGVSVVAVYDPRCYAPDDARAPRESTWMQLLEAHPARPLPTELGFGDPRVPEVREAQASLAAEHGIDAFCYVYHWDGGPRWDAPLRDLIATGRPAFPFCVLVDLEASDAVGDAEATAIFDALAPALADARYLRVDDCKLIVVRNAGRLREPRVAFEAWRKAAGTRGVGLLHVCVETLPAGSPEDFGADSFLERPVNADRTAGVAAAITAAPPPYRVLRSVQPCRDAVEPEAGEVYEFWLQSTIDATRRSGEHVVFVDAWNDWMHGRYLEPDDRSGRAALQATRRATRGPASGVVLVRRLREALAAHDGAVPQTLAELEAVMRAHEHGRDRLFAAIEAALTRNAPLSAEIQRSVPVASRQLPASSGRAMIDYLDGAGGAAVHTGSEPIELRGEEAVIAGWAHCCDGPVEAVDLFVAFESCDGSGDRIFRVKKRLSRPDVAAGNPGYPDGCGFEATLPLRDVPSGTYRVAIVQRAPGGAYRDPTPAIVRREQGPCSSA